MGAIVGIVFLVWCVQGENGWATAGIILYLFGMLMSYLASTVTMRCLPGASGRKGCANGIMRQYTGILLAATRR